MYAYTYIGRSVVRYGSIDRINIRWKGASPKSHTILCNCNIILCQSRLVTALVKEQMGEVHETCASNMGEHKI